MLVMLLVDAWLSHHLMRFARPQSIEWGGLTMDLPRDYELVTWPAAGFPAYKFIREGTPEPQSGDALYFALDEKASGFLLTKLVQNEGMCKKLKAFCVAAYSEPRTAERPACRAVIMHNAGGRPDSLEMQYVLDDSGALLDYTGSVRGFSAFLPLVKSAFEAHSKKYGVAWKPPESCALKLLADAEQRRLNATRQRPVRNRDASAEQQIDEASP
jgi:hypothetical protein